MSVRRILKYPIRFGVGAPADQHSIADGATFLDLQVQNGLLTMWWSVPLDADSESLRTFQAVPTGGAGYLDHLHYVGTGRVGDLVWHLMSHEPIPREVDRLAAPSKEERGSDDR